MLRNRPVLVVSTALFLVTETLLGIGFQVSGEHGAVLRFLTVILACLFCVLLAERSWEYLLTQLALVCTVCADWFLVLPPKPNQLPGMLFFSVAQLAYAARLYLAEGKNARRRWHWLSRVSLSAAAILATGLVLGKGTDAVAVVSMFYYASLVLNIVFAWTQLQKQAVMAVGLSLFLCCDTLVGLAFLDGYFTVAEDSFIYLITHMGFDTAWAFYLPAQMLLAVSLLPARWRASTATSPYAPANG